jgi:hypothetical protein
LSARRGHITKNLPNIASLNGNDTGIPLATKREVEKQGKKVAAGQPVHNGQARNNQNEIVVKWLEKLDDRPREMFTYIVSAYPQTITRKELGIKMGIVSKGGYFHRILQQLRKKQLVQVDFSKDEVKARTELFGK